MLIFYPDYYHVKTGRFLEGVYFHAHRCCPSKIFADPLVTLLAMSALMTE